jgi:hypothetical protein
MLKSSAEDLLAYMTIRCVVQDKLNLRHAWQQGIYDHPEHLKSHLVRRPFGLLQESVDADETLRFVQPSREDHLTDGMNAHSQDPTSDQHPEMPKVRGSETVMKSDLVNVKRLWQIPLVHRRSSPSLFQNRLWQGRRCFSRKSPQYQTTHTKSAKL